MKWVRIEIEIGGSVVLVVYVVCILVKYIFELLVDVMVLLVGVGEIIELVVKYLVGYYCKWMIVVNCM